MFGNRAASEWNLLREQFHALVREPTILKTFLMQNFVAAFSEVINAAKLDNFDRDA